MTSDRYNPENDGDGYAEPTDPTKHPMWNTDPMAAIRKLDEAHRLHEITPRLDPKLPFDPQLLEALQRLQAAGYIRMTPPDPSALPVKPKPWWKVW